MSERRFTISLGEKHEQMLDKIMKEGKIPTKIKVLRLGIEELYRKNSTPLLLGSESVDLAPASINTENIGQVNIKVVIEPVETQSKV